ncbi:MAG: energy-coupled thiamine transporter ThiT [Clostridia bacterium]|nr:energy-coupled thiamine transporter ThiT [Clostridia bacterium]
MQTNSQTTVRRLVESAILVALASVLSLLKLAELPYGGSVTCASMLPILIVAYRNGPLWGLGSGLVFSTVQLLTGLSVFSWVTGWQSVLAVALLDYVLAFVVSGLGGIFRKQGRSQASALIYGALFVSALRFVCHYISGVTVWRNISIPLSAAYLFSLVYNATYMIPETIILVTAAFYLGSILDFSYEIPRRFPAEQKQTALRSVLAFFAGLLPLAALIFDVAKIAPNLQDGETGKFTFANVSQIPWIAVAVVSGVAVLLSLVYFLIVDRYLKVKDEPAYAAENTDGAAR